MIFYLSFLSSNHLISIQYLSIISINFISTFTFLIGYSTQDSFLSLNSIFTIFYFLL